MTATERCCFALKAESAGGLERLEMSSYFRPPERKDVPAGCWVAVLDTRSLLGAEKDYSSLLSAAERERHLAFRSPQRRLEWLRGRLAAKHPVFHRLRTPPGT